MNTFQRGTNNINNNKTMLKNRFVWDDSQLKNLFGKKTQQVGAHVEEAKIKKQDFHVVQQQEVAAAGGAVVGIQQDAQRAKNMTVGVVAQQEKMNVEVQQVRENLVGGFAAAHPHRPPPPQPQPHQQPHRQPHDDQWRDGEAHYFSQFGEYKAGGNAPPVPPVGGKNFMTTTNKSFNQRACFTNEGSDSLIGFGAAPHNKTRIESDITNCQNHTPMDFSIYQIEQNQYAIKGDILEKTEAHPQQISAQTSSNTTIGSEDGISNRETMPTTDDEISHAHHAHLYKGFIDTDEIDEAYKDIQKQPVRRRDDKNATKFICVGCNTRYNKLKAEGFCHNCHLIVDAVEQFVGHQGGTVEFFQAEQTGQPFFALICAQGHNWIVDFKTKEVKKWCRACKDTEKAKRIQNLRANEEQMIRDAQRIQQALFEQAAQQHTFFAGFTADEDEEDYDPQAAAAAPWGQEDQNTRTLFMDIVEGVQTQLTDQQIAQILHFVIDQPERNLITLFEQVPRDARMRAFRRIARIVHPDKCQHPFAKDAFQKLLRSSRKLKTCNGNSIFSSYIIRILIKSSPAANHLFGAHHHHFDHQHTTLPCMRKTSLFGQWTRKQYASD